MADAASSACCYATCSGIDADTSANPGNDRFDFIGRQGFHGGGGELRFAGGVLRGDVNGDRRADFEIRIIDSAIGVGDLML
jgi:serralysin